MTFTPNFDEDPQPFFMAYVGLVPRIQYWDQDEVLGHTVIIISIHVKSIKIKLNMKSS